MSSKASHLTTEEDEEITEQIDFHVARGDRHGEAGNLNRAVAEYKKAAALAPQDAKHWRRLAEAYAAADKPQQALQYYRRHENDPHTAAPHAPQTALRWSW